MWKSLLQSRSYVFVETILYLVLSLSTTKGSSTNCTSFTIDPNYLTFHKGWENKLSCSLALRATDYSLYDLYDFNHLEEDNSVTCELLSSNGTILYWLNTTYIALESNEDSGNYEGYLLPNEDTKANYTMLLKFPRLSRCMTTTFKVNFTQLQPITCNDYAKEKKFHGASAIRGSSKFFHCRVPREMFPKLTSYHNLTFQWQRNCSTIPNSNRSLLSIRSFGYEDAGMYTCSVTYNGKARFIGFYEVCVSEPLSFQQPSLTCHRSVVSQNIGKDAVFNCIANFGHGHINDHEINLRWEKIQSNETNLGNFCYSSRYYKDRKPSKVTCSFKFVNDVCLFHVPTAKEQQSIKAIIPFQLKIRNIQPGDYGEYRITVSTNVLGMKPVTKNLTLRHEIVHQLSTTALALGICLGMMVFISIVVIGVWCSRDRGNKICNINKKQRKSDCVQVNTKITMDTQRLVSS